MARGRAPEVCLAVADEQTQGRGRLDRTWDAPPGAALLVSAGFRPLDLPVRHAWRLGATVALAMLDAAEDVAGLRDATLGLKWPNDIVADGPDGWLRKVAGVLGEATLDEDGSRPPSSASVSTPTGEPPTSPRSWPTSMTSLRELSGGRPIDRDVLLDAWVDRLEPRYEALRRGRFDSGAWSSRQRTTGELVEVDGLGGRIHARALGVDPESGSLLLVVPPVPAAAPGHRLGGRDPLSCRAHARDDWPALRPVGPSGPSSRPSRGPICTRRTPSPESVARRPGMGVLDAAAHPASRRTMSRTIALLLAALLVTGCTFTGTLPRLEAVRRPPSQSSVTPCRPQPVAHPHAAPDAPRPTPAPTAPGGVQTLAVGKRDTSPTVPARDLRAVVRGDTAFAIDLYQRLRKAEPGNIVVGPYSISVAFAMQDAGALNRTARQIEQVLHFTLPTDRLDAAFNELSLDLASRQNKRVTLSIANRLFGAQLFPFRKAYLREITRNFAAPMAAVDF